jgi:hypothetical protein
MIKYTITAEVDQQWFEILGQITRHQDGFVWCDVKTNDDRVMRTATSVREAIFGDN